jgi:hypothetical protein
LFHSIWKHILFQYMYVSKDLARRRYLHNLLICICAHCFHNHLYKLINYIHYHATYIDILDLHLYSVDELIFKKFSDHFPSLIIHRFLARKKKQTTNIWLSHYIATSYANVIDKGYPINTIKLVDTLVYD